MANQQWRAFEKETAKFLTNVFSATNAGKEIVAGYEIDCLADVKDFVFVAECKQTAPLEGVINRHDYRNEILTFSAKKNRIHNYFNRESPPKKPLWIFCVKGGLPTDKNFELALEHGITIWTDEYMKLLKKLKMSLKDELFWQVVKELGYSEETIDAPDGRFFRYPALPRMASFDNENVEVYNFFMPVRDLLPLAYVYRIKADEPESYQRLLDYKKVVDIGSFVSNGNTINTSILINLPEDSRFFEQAGSNRRENIYGFISINNIRNSIRIIDGQHRLYGFLHADEDALSQKISVIALLGASGAQEAQAFVDINENQKRVPQNDLLVILAKTDPSGAGLIPDVLMKMNETGPFKGRIKISGSMVGNLKMTLSTMNTVIKTQKIISTKNKDTYAVIQVRDFDSVEEAKKTAKSIIENFFKKIDLVASVTSEKWSSEFIYTNPGFQILIPVLKEAHKYSEGRNLNETLDTLLLHSKKFFEKYKNMIDEIRKNSSAAARARYSYELLSTINENIPGFAARLIEAYKKTSQIENETALSKSYPVQRAIKLEEGLKSFVNEILLRTGYGDKWFNEESIVDIRLRRRAEEALRGLKANYFDLGERVEVMHPVYYLDLTGLKEIIRRNRASFRSVIDAGFEQFIADIDIIRIIGNKRHEGMDPVISHRQLEVFEAAEKRITTLLGSYRKILDLQDSKPKVIEVPNINKKLAR